MSSLFAILMAIGCSSPPTGPQSAQEDVADNAPTPTEPDTPSQVTDPGQVTDLIVTDSTGTAVTLSFTQVDDGAGNPADYAVRTHVGPMNWGEAEEVSQGTCAAPLQGTAIGATMSCTIEGLLPDVAYTFQVAAFRGTFQAGAVYGELSNIVPDMGDEPEQAPPSDGSRPNEPVGYKVIASSGFPCVPDLEGYCADSGDWRASTTDSNLSVVSDGGSSVLRTRFPAGQRAGRAPTRLDAWDSFSSPTVMRELYQSMHIRLVSGAGDGQYEFYSGVNKLGFWGVNEPVGHVPTDLSVNCAPDLQNQGTGVLDDHCTLKYVQENNVFRNQNTGHVIQVGRWYHWEFQFILNDPANNFVGENGKTYGDGTFRWWVDGVLIQESLDVAFVTDASHGFYQYRWNPTWGGGSGHDDRKRTDYVDLEDLYISGVPE